MRRKIPFTMFAAACALALSPTHAPAQFETPPASNVRGKKLICITQKLMRTDVAELPRMVESWQDSGYDGVSVSIAADPTVYGRKKTDHLFVETSNMRYAWWRNQKHRYDALRRDVEILEKIQWGRLTDNFLWMTTFADHRNPHWFDDEGWETLLHNARLAARIAKQIGFKGIILDAEAYSGDQSWKIGHLRKQIPGSPSLAEINEKVRQRGSQWAKAICDVYPDIVLGLMSMYVHPWIEARASGYDHEAYTMGAKAPFIDGLVTGLGKRALIVNFSQQCYVDSTYERLARIRNECMEQALVMSSVPDLVRRRVSYATGLWTDTGFGSVGRFSNTDVRVNHRDPDRHKHATHNALAVSGHYVWHWSENGPDGSYSFLTTEPTPLMRQYWQANIDAHEPMALDWEPPLRYDTTDYTQANAAAAETGARFFASLETDGYTVAAELPEVWKFRLDTHLHCSWFKLWATYYDDRSWHLIRPTSCWQSQGIRANDNGLYRVWFDVPSNLDGEKQQIVLAFGHLGQGGKYVHLNGGWIDSLKQVVDVSKTIKPGERNLLGIQFMNREGPAGLMGEVKLLVREGK